MPKCSQPTKSKLSKVLFTKKKKGRKKGRQKKKRKETPKHSLKSLKRRIR
jgi:hypothetical protein